MEKNIKNFKDLDVFQRAYNLALEIHEVSLSFPRLELYELGSQLRRSSKAIPANIAEGHGRRSVGEYKLFLTYAIASCDETKVHLNFAYDLKYISKEKYLYFIENCDIIGKQLYNLIRSLTKTTYAPMYLGTLYRKVG